MSSMLIITLCSRWLCIYMNLPSKFDTMPDTYCLSLHGCIYCLRVSSCVVFMLKCAVYLQVGIAKLMPDKCVFVKSENSIIGVPAMQSADDVIQHRFWLVCTSIVSIALRTYPSNSHSIVTLFFIVYLYNNVLRYYCDELFESIEVSNTEDASREKGLWYLLCCTI